MIQTSSSSSMMGQNPSKEIFLLTDEQILEVDPEPQDVEISAGSPATSAETPMAIESSSSLATASAKPRTSSVEDVGQDTAQPNAPRHKNRLPGSPPK